MTLEIDPATCDQARLEGYLALGANRFSVGAQTFNERLLKVAGRKHSSHDTVELLQLLKRNKVNYSFDLLFGLPTQTLEELRADVATALAFDPSHLSAYCLTVPEAHPMSKSRAPDEEQVDMFNVIESELAKAGVLRYEISNFAKPGFESKHNLLYWTDQPYWGLGTSAHSYFPPRFSKNVDAVGDSGLRFWNAPSLPAYEKEVRRARSQEWSFVRDIPEAHREILERHQALTDFCHTSLRLKRGLEENALRLRFGASVASIVTSILGDLSKGTWIQTTQNGWAMTAEGRVMANAVFEKLTFLADDLKGLPGPN
jgi:oxygen-independent coproporphyrinogen-3 oxidase